MAVSAVCTSLHSPAAVSSALQQGNSSTQGNTMGALPAEETDRSSGASSIDSGFSDTACNNSNAKVSEGCEHYRRKAKVVAACCSRAYACRFCHDEAEDHVMDRFAVTEMECNYCDIRQPMSQNCAHCHNQLGRYFCTVCRLHDNEEKKQFHCTQCGICRSGGRDNFFHCDNCDLCLPNHMKNNHKCVNGVGRSDCGVCLEDIHSSRTGGQVLPCGHLLHVYCFREMIKHRISTCPKCKVSIKNREREWARMDAEIRRSKVPAEFRHSQMEALCCDCHTTAVTTYHIVGLKCANCGSYNTVPAGPLQRQEVNHGLSSLFKNMRSMMARVR